MTVATQVRQSRLLLVYAILASTVFSCLIAALFVRHAHSTAQTSIKEHATVRSGQIVTRFQHRLSHRWKTTEKLSKISRRALDRELRAATNGFHFSRIQIQNPRSTIVHAIDARPLPKGLFARENALKTPLQNSTISSMGRVGNQYFVRASFPLHDRKRNIMGTAQIWIDVTYGISLAERSNKQSLNLLIFSTLSFATLLFCIGEILVRRMGAALEATVRSQEELERSQSLARVGLMVAGLSHQLRNPVSILSGIVTSLNRREVLEQQKPFLKALTEETQRVRWLTETFLDFARPLKVHAEKHNVREILQRVEKVVHALRPDVEVVFKGPDSLHFIFDQELVFEALSNVVTNSVEAIKQTDKALITIEFSAHGDVLNLQVTDNGHGFAREQIDKLRKGPQPFYTTKAKGNGLGLAVAEKVVAAHGGNVELSNVSSGGARVILTLP